MNCSDSIRNSNNVMNSYLLSNARFKGSVVFVKVGESGKIFCEVGSSLYGHQKYYALDEFFGANIIRRCANGQFSNTSETVWNVRKPFLSLADGYYQARGHIPDYLFDCMVMRELCSYITAEITPLSLNEVLDLGPMEEDRTVTGIYQVNDTGKYIYIINNVVYSEHFPIEWALTPEKFEWDFNGETDTHIMGPGTSKNHCGNCNYYGSLHGVFLGYCSNCAKMYEYSRGNGFMSQGIIMYEGEDEETLPTATYLSGLDLTTLGYNRYPLEQYNTCLSGGELPTGPDICDNQADMDPVNEDEEDEYEDSPEMSHKQFVPSNKYPRRAYGIPSIKYRTVLDQAQTEKLTPDIIRDKLEVYFAENGIVVNNNNYSFPIGPRPEWDCYRITKQPSNWFEWKAAFHRQGEENIKLEIRLHVSNVHSQERPATLLLECNNVSGRSKGYWVMMSSMKNWLLGETDSPIIDFPHPVVYPYMYEEGGQLIPPSLSMFAPQQDEDL